MTDFKDRIDADLRLTILRLLSSQGDYELNSSILRDALDEYGHHVSTDRLVTELAWLEEQRLLSTHSAGTLVVARLSGRGRDVGEGRVQVPGIARPEPGDIQ